MRRVHSLFILLLFCASLQAAEDVDAPAEVSEETSMTEEDGGSLVIDRLRREREVDDNPSVLLAHKRNYFLPVTYAREPNNEPYQEEFGEEVLDNVEAQFQISLKLPITEGLFTENDAIFGGFTLKAFWQVYNTDLSAPFRETNYEPEIFWLTPIPWNPFGGDATLVTVGLSHQSNGRTQLTSRSWNRRTTCRRRSSCSSGP